MTSTLPPLVQACSGAIGSACANAITYPLDLIATRLQTTSSRKLRGLRGVVETFKHILRAEGWNGLYDGVVTDTSATIVSNFLYFYFYTLLRGLMVRRKVRNTPPRPADSKALPLLLSMPEELGIGFLAGAASRAISTPLSVITVRLQTRDDDENPEDKSELLEADLEMHRKPMGAVETVKRIYSEEGLKGLWGGFSTTVPLSLNPAITLLLFQIFRKLVSRYEAPIPSSKSGQKIATPSARAAFVGAAFSNAVATMLLYPLILAKTRLQAHKKNGDGDSTMVKIWSAAFEREGVQGLYQGLDAQIMKGFVNQGVTMMIKQRVELFIVALYIRGLKR